MFTKSNNKVASLFSLSTLAFAAVFAVSTAGCAADASEDEGRVAQKQDVPADPVGPVVDPVVAPVMIDQGSKDKVVQASAGQAIILALPSNATTGYEWVIKSERAFGEPTVSNIVEGEGMGAGGKTQFVWADTKTMSPGRYTLALDYARSWEPGAADTFSCVIEIVK